MTLAMALTTTTGFCGKASLDDGGDAVDGFGVFDGSAAELHDDHRRDFLGESFDRSAGSAAPRQKRSWPQTATATCRTLRRGSRAGSTAAAHAGATGRSSQVAFGF